MQKVNKKEMIEILKFYYGLTIKQCNEYIKRATPETLQELKKGYYEQLHRAFLED